MRNDAASAAGMASGTRNAVASCRIVASAKLPRPS